jgi:hypothetical protein
MRARRPPTRRSGSVGPDRERRPGSGLAPPSLPATDRAQTIQDYAIGVGLFLVVVAFVLAFLPSIFAPFQVPIQSDQTAQAERLATVITAEVTEPYNGTVLNHSASSRFFSDASPPADGPAIRNRYNMDVTVQVNVTLQTVESLPDRHVGPDVGNRAVASSARVVTDNGVICRPTCRLIVRVW